MIGSIVGIIALSGCSKEVGTEAQLEQEVKELEQKVKEQQKVINQYQAKQKELDQKKKQESIEVAVIEPDTGKVIKKIKPEELGFFENIEDYEKRIADWVKDVARSENGYDKRMFPDKIGADGEVVKGTPRVILSEDELVNQIMDASDERGRG